MNIELLKILVANAQYKPTDADLVNIKSAGLRLVAKPNSNVISLLAHQENNRVMMANVSAEA